MARHDPLTIEEEKFIKAHAEDMAIGDIATALGRSYFTIQKVLKLLGVNIYHSWTDEEDAILISNYGKMPTAQLAEFFGVDEYCVYNRIRRMKKNGKFVKTKKKRGE